MAVNNNVTLIGRLTKDVEIRKTPQGISVAQFDLAVERFKKEDGADFIRCQAWRQGAEYLSLYAKKGYMIAISGRISTRNYDNQQGQKVYITEVICDSVKIVSSPTQSQNNNQAYQQENDVAAYSGGFEINTDDLPF